jgi:tetratricopeptide (TPR) repeat protein
MKLSIKIWFLVLFRFCLMCFLIALALNLHGFSQEMDSQNLEVYLKQAQLAEQRYQYQAALEWYEKALELKPNDTAIMISMAEQLIGLEQLDETAEILRNVLEIDKVNVDAHIYLGIYYRKLKEDLEMARYHFQLAIQSDPTIKRARVLLGELYINLLDYPSASKMYTELLEIDPKSYQGLLGLGKTQLKQKHAKEAIQNFLKAIKLRNDEPEPFQLLAQAFAREKQREQAQKCMELFHLKDQQKDRIIELTRVVRHNPDNANNWFQLGKEYTRQKQELKAIDTLLKGLEIAPNRYDMHGLVGSLLLNQKQASLAEKHLSLAIKHDQDNGDLLNNLGVCYMFQRKYNQAREAFEKAIQLGTDNPNIRKNLDAAILKLQEQK